MGPFRADRNLVIYVYTEKHISFVFLEIWKYF